MVMNKDSSDKIGSLFSIENQLNIAKKEVFTKK